MSFNHTQPLELSDGTPVEFVKTTSKGNTQVRLPESHELASEDPLRIFRPDGSHYKDNLFEQSGQPITLRNAEGASTEAPATEKPDLTGILGSITGGAAVAEGSDASFELRIGSFVLRGSVSRG